MGYTVVIPTLNPAPEFPGIVAGMTSDLIDHIVIVNDGSDHSYDTIFAEAEQLPRVHVIGYETNCGKGHAMKTAYTYIRDNLDTKGVITVDSDGQHLLKDVVRCLQELDAHPEALILGVRDFNQANVPARSRFGNKMTSLTFLVGCGIRISDTQTGLRAFSSKYLDLLINTRGERYEYETEMLLKMSREKIPFREVTIETVYLNDNEASHFHPIRDSFRIYTVIFKYIATSLGSWVIDNAAFALLNILLSAVLPGKATVIANIGARLISSIANYFMNRYIVFESDNHLGRELGRYYILAACNLACSTALIWFFSNVVFHLGEEATFWHSLIKVCVDCFLFVVVFFIKQRLVFAKQKKDTRQ